MELIRLRRRDLLAGMCAAPWFGLAGCQQAKRLPPAGEIVDTLAGFGHRLRDGYRPQPADDAWEDVGVLIVGGGVAGLSAAWQFRRQGFEDVVVIEMDHDVGGTSQSTQYGSIAAPWGAHYLPLPMPHQTDLISLLDEMGVLEGRGPNGEPIAAEQYLVRDPEERIHHDGSWYEGLFLFEDASEDDLRQWKEFHVEVRRWADWRDNQGRRAFTIPLSQGSEDPEVTRLDSITFADWLVEHGWNSPRVRWSLDYACRDDYCLSVEQTSAWAGLFYYAARLPEAGVKPQPLMTWPEGNGRIVAHLREQTAGKLRTKTAVTEIRPALQPEESIRVITATEDGQVRGYRAKRIVWAAPQLLTTRVIHGIAEDADRAAAVKDFQYGAWLVANICLSGRPLNHGFPPAWDNVFYESRSLGYVVATHQLGIEYGPTVWTYYFPLCGDNPMADRRWLLEQSWTTLADFVLSDIEQVHPEIRQLTTRLDIQRWGHGMIRPVPGFVWGRSRRFAAQPWQGIHFANTDLSGVALFEEAFDHGIRAARNILAEISSARSQSS